MTEQARFLIDTNILLRISNPAINDHLICSAAISILLQQDASLFYTVQNATEYWNVSTRPVERNGQGLTIPEVTFGLSLVERKMLLLVDDEHIYPEWRRLVTQHSIRGVQVHDARLAASMIVHQVPRILTLNTRDFARFPETEAIHPASLLQ